MTRGALPSRTSAKVRWWEPILWLVLILLAVSLLFWELGDSTLHDGDEALYAAVARSMSETGDWLDPTYWEEPFLHKPPLAYWLMAFSYSVLPGSEEFQARFPSAFCAIALLAAVYLTGRRLGGPWVGAGAVMLLLSNHQFLFEHCARSANLDSIAMCFLFIALVVGAQVRSSAGRLCSAVSIGAAAMVKLPLVVFILMPVFVWLWFRGRDLAFAWLISALLGLGVLALPWHLYGFFVHGKEFWDTYFMYEMLGRAGSTARAPFSHAWIHLDAWWRSFLPWSPLLAAATVAALAGWPKRDMEDRSHSLRSLLAAYAVLFMLVFACIPSKWPWYGLPAYPALAVVGAAVTGDLLRSKWRYFIPPIMAALAAWRLLMIHPVPAYSPASRPSWLWPAHDRLYRFGWEVADVAIWVVVAGVVVVALLSAVASLRTRRAAVWGTAVIATLIFSLSISTMLGVPRNYECATRRLTQSLTNEGVRTVVAMGFHHEPRYNGRMEPLVSYYLLGMRDVRVIDWENRRGGDGELLGKTAVIMNADTVAPSVAERLPRQLQSPNSEVQVWLLDPNSSDRFRRLAFDGR